MIIRVLLCFVLLQLAACGGGGGGGDSTPVVQDRAVNDSVALDEDTSVSINVLTNDVGVNASSLSLAGNVASGMLELSAGNFIYTPNPDFFGSDSFSYSVTSNGGTQLTATVNITVRNINDAPVVADDNYTLLVNTPTVFNVVANDVDIDNTLGSDNVEVLTAPAGGSLAIVGGQLVYTPDAELTGQDTFTYQVNDGAGGISGSANVQIQVNPITETTVSYLNLTVPTTGYDFTSQTQLGGTVLNSANQVLTVPANARAILLQFRGAGIGRTSTAMQLSRLTDSAGLELTRRETIFCDIDFCSALIPRRPDHEIPLGDWEFTLGTQTDSITGFDFSSMALSAVVRTGPRPDTSLPIVAALPIRVFLVSADLTADDLSPIMKQFSALFANNQMQANLDPLVIINDLSLAQPSTEFNDALTEQLVLLGATDRINLFFVDGFEGPSGSSYLGISGGLPGPVGEQNGFNGILINAQATRAGPSDYWHRTTAEFAFHEMGHYLGLYHTTEGDFSAVDVLDDTLSCNKASHDLNENDRGEYDECPDGYNPMFWQNDLLTAKESLTPDQKYVLFNSLLAQPL